MSIRADLALLGLAVLGVLANLACILTGHPAPAIFDQVTLAGLTAAAGVAMPRSAATSTPPAPTAPVSATSTPVVTGPTGQ